MEPLIWQPADTEMRRPFLLSLFRESQPGFAQAQTQPFMDVSLFCLQPWFTPLTRAGLPTSLPKESSARPVRQSAPSWCGKPWRAGSPNDVRLAEKATLAFRRIVSGKEGNHSGNLLEDNLSSGNPLDDNLSAGRWTLNGGWVDRWRRLVSEETKFYKPWKVALTSLQHVQFK